MSDSPIITVRVHLGDMGKEILHLDDDSERSDWLLGFHAGALGRAPREGWSQAKSDGFNFGACALAEANEFRSGRSRGGKASADKRKEKYGSAQPSNLRTDLEQVVELSSNSARSIELSSKSVRDFPEQDIEQPSNQPTTYRQQPATSGIEPFNQKTQQPATSDFQGLTVPPPARVAAPAWSPDAKAERWSARRQKWLEDRGEPVDFTQRPGILTFLSYVKAVHPSWQEKHARAAFDEWVLRGWTVKGKRIGSWWQVADAWADNADQTEHFEKIPMGSFAAGLGISDSMSAKSTGLTKELI